MQEIAAHIFNHEMNKESSNCWKQPSAMWTMDSALIFYVRMLSSFTVL